MADYDDDTVQAPDGLSAIVLKKNYDAGTAVVRFQWGASDIDTSYLYKLVCEPVDAGVYKEIVLEDPGFGYAELTLDVGNYEYRIDVCSPDTEEVLASVSGYNSVWVDTVPMPSILDLRSTVSNGQLVLTWRSPYEEDLALYYDVQYSTHADFSDAETIRPFGTTAQLPLTPGETLYYRIKLNDILGNYSEWTEGRYENTFGEVRNLGATVTGKSVTFNWEPVSGAVTYTVRITGPNGKTTVKTVKTNSLKLSLSDGGYTWTVEAASSDGMTSGPAKGDVVTVDVTAPKAVTNPTVTAGNDNEEAILSWGVAVDASPVEYRVEYSSKSNFSDMELPIVTGDTEATIKVTPGEYTYYRITAVDSFGNKSKTVTGKYGAPTLAPAKVGDAVVSGKNVSVSWEEVKGAVSYIVSFTNAAGKVTTKTVKNATSLTTSLADGAYSWSVRAVSAAKIESAAVSGESFILDITPPKAVTKLGATYAGEGEVTLSWTAPKDATDLLYKVEYATKADFSDAEIVGEPVSDTSAKVSSASGYWRVTAIDAAGNVSPGAGISVLTATTSGKKATLTWAAVEGAASYVVTITGADGKETTKTVKTNTLAATLTDGSYKWTVKAQRKDGTELAVQNGAGFTLDTIAPTVVTDLSANHNDGKTAILSWGASSDAADVTYIVEYSTDKKFKKDVVSQETTDTTAELPVKPGEYVYYRITAVDAFGNKSKTVSGEYGEPISAPAVKEPAVDGKNVVLAWDAVEGAASYTVKYTNAAGKTTTKTVKNATSLAISISEGAYSWEVQAVSAAGVASAAAKGADFIYDITAPKAVTKLAVQHTGVGKMSLSWVAPTDATALTYVVEWSEFNDFYNAEQFTSSKPGIELDGLPEGRIVYYRVMAKDAKDNTSEWASGVTATACEDLDWRGLGLEATTQGKTASLLWTPVLNAASYEVRISNLDDGKTVEITKKVTTNTLDVKLRDGEFEWSVAALDANGNEFSYAGNGWFQVDSVAPGKIKGLELCGLKNDGVVLEWEDSEDATFVRYIVEYSTTSNFAKGTVKTMVVDGMASAAVPGTGPDGQLPPDQYMYMRVRAVDAKNNMSAWSSTLKYGYVAAPDDISISTDPLDEDTPRGNKIDVKWRPSEAAVSYVLTFYKEDGGGKVVRKVSLSGLVEEDGFVRTTVTVPDGDYEEVSVQAVSSKGISSEECSVVERFTVDSTAPTAIKDFEVHTYAGYIAFSWIPSKDISDFHYEVQVSTTSTFEEGTFIVNEEISSYEPGSDEKGFHFYESFDLGSYAGDTVYYRFRAVDEYKNSTAWKSGSVVTMTEVPEHLEVTPNGKKVTLSWTKVADAKSYVVEVYSADTSELVMSKTVKTNSLTASFKEDGEYYWNVTAYYRPAFEWEEAHEPAHSYGGYFLVDSIAPTPIKSLSATQDGGYVMLTWSESTDNNWVEYVVEIADNSKFTNAFTDDDCPYAEYRYGIDDFEGDTLYYRVMAVDPGGNKTAWSSGSLALQRQEPMVAALPVAAMEVAPEVCAPLAVVPDQPAVTDGGVAGEVLDKELSLSTGAAVVVADPLGLGDAGCAYGLEPETEATRRDTMLAAVLH